MHSYGVCEVDACIAMAECRGDVCIAMGVR